MQKYLLYKRKTTKLLIIKCDVCTNMHTIQNLYKLRGITSRNPIVFMKYILSNVRSAFSIYHENTNYGLPFGLPGK